MELKSEKGQPEVNLLVLDQLVHDYMLEEDLIDDEGTSLRPDGSAVVRSPNGRISFAVGHTLYSLNLASKEPSRQNKALNRLLQELRCA